MVTRPIWPLAFHGPSVPHCRSVPVNATDEILKGFPYWHSLRISFPHFLFLGVNSTAYVHPFYCFLRPGKCLSKIRKVNIVLMGCCPNISLSIKCVNQCLSLNSSGWNKAGAKTPFNQMKAIPLLYSINAVPSTSLV